MTRRQENVWLIGLAVLYMTIILSVYFIASNIRRKPQFVEPVIWRELYTGGAPPLEFDI